MSSSHRELFPSVDENKALEQLEKFQREIQSARWKREHASAEFEAFVKGFNGAPEGEAPSDPAAADRGRGSSPSVRAMRRSGATPPPRPPAQTPAAPPARVPVPPPRTAAPEPALQTTAAAPETTSYSTRLQHWRGNALVGAALVAIVLLAIGWWKNSPSSSPRVESGAAVAPGVAPAAQPAPAPPATNTEPAPGAAPIARHAARVTTSRRVWVRVMADGHRLFERELAAGESVPIDATQAIVIRAGNAGAVRLTFADGRDETLGAEGQVVTRRFEIRNDR